MINYNFLQRSTLKKLNEFNIKISSIARGISVGNELEYIDELTLGTAITSRVPYENSVSN